MEVIVYTGKICPYCEMLKRFLKQNNVKFKEINVSKSRKAVIELVQKTGQIGVPVTDIDGSIVIGFNKEKLKELLKI